MNFDRAAIAVVKSCLGDADNCESLVTIHKYSYMEFFEKEITVQDILELEEEFPDFFFARDYVEYQGDTSYLFRKNGTYEKIKDDILKISERFPISNISIPKHIIPNFEDIEVRNIGPLVREACSDLHGKKFTMAGGKLLIVS